MPFFTKSNSINETIETIKHLEQGWPKCGPPKIFCGPCVKFWMLILAIKAQSCTKNTWNWHELCQTLRKISQEKILRPAVLFWTEIWPSRKKFWPPLHSVLINRGHTRFFGFLTKTVLFTSYVKNIFCIGLK